jgi:hypothetical protein
MHQSNGRQVENEVSITFVLREVLALSLFLVPAGCACFGPSLAFPFCLPCDGSGHRSFIGFLDLGTDCNNNNVHR